jgi:hypothetical protein
MPNIKKSFKNWWASQKQQRAENVAFNKERKQAEKKAEREAYFGERVRQARKKGRAKARGSGRSRFESFGMGAMGAANALFGDGSLAPSTHRKSGRHKYASHKGTTISVNGTTIHVSKSGKHSHRKKRRSSSSRGRSMLDVML